MKLRTNKRTFAWHIFVRMKAVLPSLPVTASDCRVKKSEKKSECSAIQKKGRVSGKNYP